MNQISMPDLFATPEDYQPVPDNELRDCTTYPNLNSTEYMKKAPNFNIKLQSFFEVIDINDDGNVVLGCNDYASRVWNGSLWGFERPDDVGKSDKATYKSQCQSTITDIKYSEKSMILVAESNGSFQLWSTYSEVRSTDGYCLFMLGGVNEHVGIINAIDIFKKNSFKAVTVDSDCCIKLWDMTGGDLTKTLSLKNAHGASITSVSTSPDDDSVFVTTSRDKSVLLWDNRLRLPCSGLRDDYICAFTALSWNYKDQKCGNIIYVGDELGTLHSIDNRKPQEFLASVQVFNRAVNKIKIKGNHIAVSGNTNEIKVFDALNNKQIYANSKSKNYVRDMCWMPKEKNTLYSIGWDSKIHKHTVSG